MLNRFVTNILQKGFNESIKEAYIRFILNTYGEMKVLRKLTSKLFTLKIPNKWIFILGCYNSGTTLLQRLLALHPSIRTLPKEGVRFTGEFRRPEDIGWTRMWNECLHYMFQDLQNGPKEANQIVKDWSPWWEGTGPVFIEKSITNILRAEWLQQHFPNSYFVGITRDGYAVSEGITRRARPKGQAKRKIGEYYPIEMAANEWVVANQLLLDYRNTLQRYTVISYEELLSTPNEYLKYLFEFLDLEQPTITYTENSLFINGTRHELWDGNKYSISRLSNAQLEKISSIIAPMQQKLGYPLLPKFGEEQ